MVVALDTEVEYTKAKVKCERTRLQDRLSTDERGSMIPVCPYLTRSVRCSVSSGRTTSPISISAISVDETLFLVPL